MLPEILQCDEYVNADSIAAGISPFRPDGTAMLAGRLMLERIHCLSEKGVDFAFESTMASRSFAPFLDKCKDRGYTVTLLFLWLSSPDLAVQRVADRVIRGGHDVQEETIRRRYRTGLRNFLNLYIPIADNWLCYDNSGNEASLVVVQSQGLPLAVRDEPTWRTILEMSV